MIQAWAKQTNHRAAGHVVSIDSGYCSERAKPNFRVYFLIYFPVIYDIFFRPPLADALSAPQRTREKH